VIAADRTTDFSVERDTREPVFLLACARSGSTLLRVMLAGHPDLFCPPELNLLSFETLAQRDAQLGACRMERYREMGLSPAQGLLRAVMELQALDAASSQRVIDSWVEAEEPVGSVFTKLSRWSAPRRLVDKSTFYGASMQTLRRAEELFAAPRYIYLHRHPYPVVASLIRNRFRGQSGRDLARTAEALWARVNSNILQFLRDLEPERYIQISYESLVAEPAPTMSEVCSFLAIPLHEAVVMPYSGSRMTDGVRAGLPALGDVDFHSHTRIEPELGRAWETLSLRCPLSIAVPVAKALRYELPDAS
jgi:Sulfotransferase family